MTKTVIITWTKSSLHVLDWWNLNKNSRYFCENDHLNIPPVLCWEFGTGLAFNNTFNNIVSRLPSFLWWAILPDKELTPPLVCGADWHCGCFCCCCFCLSLLSFCFQTSSPRTIYSHNSPVRHFLWLSYLHLPVFCDGICQILFSRSDRYFFVVRMSQKKRSSNRTSIAHTPIRPPWGCCCQHTSILCVARFRSIHWYLSR